MRVIKVLINLMVVLLPWCIKRFVLNFFYGYKLNKKSHIGFSYIFPKHLEMAEGANIGHLNVAIHLEKIVMEKDCTICQRNWITGFPLNNKTCFQEFPDRMPQLVMKQDSAITKNHLIDCTDTIVIGELTSIAGYGSQILTHSTGLKTNRQGCSPIKIGHHCFVGTRSIILPGAVLPDKSVLGAGAVLKNQYDESFALYGGVPAKFIKKMDTSCSFFNRVYRPDRNKVHNNDKSVYLDDK